MTLKLLPPLLSGLGWARTLPPELTMVISLPGNEEIVPDLAPAFTVAPVRVQVPKLMSGNKVPVAVLTRRCATHSALVSLQVAAAQAWVVLKLLPAVVESVTFRR